MLIGNNAENLYTPSLPIKPRHELISEAHAISTGQQTQIMQGSRFIKIHQQNFFSFFLIFQ